MTCRISFFPPGATVQGNTLYLVGGNTNDQLNITPIGASQTGSTGINVNGQLNGVNINNQTFTGVTSIYAVGFGGNDNFQFAGSLTIASVVRAGDGNDQIQLDNGNNTVNLGDGNDTVTPWRRQRPGHARRRQHPGRQRQQHRHCRQWQRPGATR